MEKQVLGQSIRLKINEGLTANNIPKFNKSLDELLALEDNYQEIILDLTNVDNIDSVGVTYVIGIYKKMKSLSKSFKVSGASSDVKSLFKLMKLDQFFEMID